MTELQRYRLTLLKLLQARLVYQAMYEVGFRAAWRPVQDLILQGKPLSCNDYLAVLLGTAAVSAAPQVAKRLARSTCVLPFFGDNT